MKTILSIALLVLFNTNINAQASAATQTLLPDQNPNYQKSRDKYMEQSATLTQNEGLTVQNTYKAIDDVQAKKERKELAASRRQDRRMARIQARGNRRTNRGGYNNNRYYNNGYNNNGYYNNGYNNNNGYYSNPSGFYSPQYYSNNIYGSVNSVLNTALLGLTVWSLLKH